MSKTTVEAEIEAFRQLVIAAKTTGQVEKLSRESQQRLNELFQSDPKLFSEEDVRWLNVLSGFLGVRLESHRPKQPHTRQKKRKGDTLDHCWRCETPIDERFTALCESCSTKAYKWMICPVCGACGCQKARKVLV